MEFAVGRTYQAVLNGTPMTFKVLDVDVVEDEFFVRWDDGDEEWLYRSDAERYVRAAAIDI